MKAKSSPLYRISAFAIFWFFLTLSVTSSIVPIPDVFVEHRIYLPSMVLIPGLVVGTYAFGKRLHFPSRFLTGALMCFVLLFGVATVQRNTLWTDALSLWQNVASRNPHHARAYNMIGVISNRRGDKEGALKAFRLAIDANPRYAEAHVNLGNHYLENGQPEEALSEFMTAMNLQDLDPIDTSILYVHIPRYFMFKGMPLRSIEYLNLARRLTPQDANVYYFYSLAYRRLGDNVRADEFLGKARELNPERFP